MNDTGPSAGRGMLSKATFERAINRIRGGGQPVRTREELKAELSGLQVAPEDTRRREFLGIGDQLLTDGDIGGALEAFLKAYDCHEKAKWEFGERLLSALEHHRIGGGDVVTVVSALTQRGDQVIVPDLWKGLVHKSARETGRAEAEPVLRSLAGSATEDMLHEAADRLREAGTGWAGLIMLEALNQRALARSYTPGSGFYLKFGHALMADRRIAPAVDAYATAHKLDPEAPQHAGAHLDREFAGLGFTVDEYEQLGRRLEAVGMLPVEIRLKLLDLLSAKAGNDVDWTGLDWLTQGMPARQLVKAGDKALAEARHSFAIYCYESAIKRDPQDVLLRLQLGITNYLANDHQAAEAHFAILMTLQESERQRWGVDQLPVRVMHWTWLQAFGHVTCLDTYIKAIKLGWLPDYRSYLAFDQANPPAGWRLLPYFAKHLEIVAARGEMGPVLDGLIFGDKDAQLSPHQKNLRRASMMNFFWSLPNQNGRMRYFGNIGSDVQLEWKKQGRGPLLEVSDEERNRFRAVMAQSFGLPEDAWFVVLHVRESTFKPGWETHHQYTRNASIDDYDAAIDYIISRGGWVIRAGDPSMRRIPKRDKVIDYATSPMRSPELDVLLCAECRFFLGTNSGFSLTPPLFGKRCVLTNWSPLANPNWYPDDIFIPKVVRERKTGRYLTLKEMYASKAGWSQFARDFEKDWQKIDNTPEEIVAVVKEMMDELENGPSRSPAALQREQLYHDVILSHAGYIGSRLSDGYLERNPWLLEDVAATSKAAE